MNDDLAVRLDRLEAIHAIEQLAMRYALAVDGRDIDAWLALFPLEVDCGRHGKGREVLRGLIEPQLRTFYRSIHQICGHRIEFDGPDSARGVVYCRAEHEVGGKWIVMAIAYFDSYARHEGEWHFVRRREQHWYAADWQHRPSAPFTGWDEHPAPPTLPQDFASWASFWADMDETALGTLTAMPTGG